MTIEKKSIDIIEIIDRLLLNALTEKDEEKIHMVKEMVHKMNINMKEDFIHYMCIDLYVSDIKNATIELQSHMIEKVSNFWLVYLFREIIRSDFKLGKENVRIQFFKYTQKCYETKEFLNTLMNSVTYLDRGITLNLDSIENILTATNKRDYAKGAKKSVIYTLTGKKKEKSFRPHPEAEHRIVEIEELGKYLDIEGKHKRINCPVCYEGYVIDKNNIDEYIKFKNNVFTFHCLHTKTGNSEDLKKDIFQRDLSIYFKKNELKINKQMFILNNFKRIASST